MSCLAVPFARLPIPLSALLLICLLTPGSELCAQQLEWLSRFGSSAYDEAQSVAVDATGVYVGGRTRAPLDNQAAGFEFDGYLQKYTHDGTLLWTRQFQAFGIDDPSTDIVWSVAAAEQGIFVTGYVECLGSACPSGGFVTRFDAEGNRDWTHMFGRMDSPASLVVHDSGLFVGGTREGAPPTAVLAKVDFSGNEVWTQDVGPNMRLTRIAVDDQGIYGVGFLGDADVRMFDLDGHEVGQLGAGEFDMRAIDTDESGIYVAGQARPFAGNRLQKYRRSGEMIWQREQLFEPQDLEVDDGGLTVVYRGGDSPTVAHYNLDGAFIWQGRFGERLLAADLAVAGDGIFITGIAFGTSEEDTDSFVAGLSPQFPPQIVGLGQVPGSSAMAVLTHDPNTDRVTARVRDAATGDLIANVRFTPGYHPQRLIVVPDVDGNGIPELALLGIHRTDGNVVSQLRDAVTGSPIAAVAFHTIHQPLQFLQIPDVDGSGTAGIALFGLSGNDRILRTEIRTAVTGAAVRTVAFDQWDLDQWQHAIQVALPDAGRNGGATLARIPLLSAFGSEATWITIKDALTGELAAEYGIPGTHTVLDALALPDLNGVRGSEIATLERSRVRQGIRAAIRDGGTGAHIRTMYFTRAGEPGTLIEVPDLNGNGSSEIGLISTNVGPRTDTVEIKDPASGEWISRSWMWHGGSPTFGWAVLPDIDGNGSAELAQLQRLGAALSVLIKDARTGRVVGRVYF